MLAEQLLDGEAETMVRESLCACASTAYCLRDVIGRRAQAI
jgi:hypothetical protein